MFGRAKVNPDARQPCIEYLVRLMALVAKQDDASARYNDALIRSGGLATALLDDAVSELAHFARPIEAEHSALGSVPAEAMESYGLWQQVWLQYRMWCEVQAAVIAAGDKATPEALQLNRTYLAESERTRKRAEAAELRLMKCLRMNASEVQQVMTATSRH